MKYFDMHCDTLYELCHQKESLKDNEKLHISLNKSAHLAHYAQFFAMFCGTAEVEDDADADHRLTALLQTAERELSGNSDRLRLCRTRSDLSAAQAEGKAAAFLTVEGADLLPDETALDRAWQAGVRLVTLTWNHRNRYGCSARLDQSEGLTAAGRAFVRACESQKVILDASHLSDAGFYDLLRPAQRPFVASHSNSRAVCPHPRNLTDEQFRAICQLGGTAGINLYGPFLSESAATLDDVCRHIEHFCALGGASHVALGGDLDGCDTLPAGFSGVEDYEKLAAALSSRGYPEEIIRGIFSDSLLKVVKQCIM